MADETRLDEAAVRALALAVELPLPPEREAMAAEQLSVWLTAANELNRKMAAAELWAVTPITVFTHPSLEGEES
jgi:hypothetical protein